MADLRRSFLMALAGAFIAACFGVIHDQVTYTISPEYFTRMKFDQFRGADFGLPPRAFVAVIGVLGTWWAGLIGGWFLSRVATGKSNRPSKAVAWSLGFVMLVTLVSGASGFYWGIPFAEAVPGWDDEIPALGVTDVPAFQRVAGIHIGSYLGALLGWILAMARLLNVRGASGC